MSAAKVLARRLARLRRRALALGLTRGIATGIAAALAVVCGTAWLDVVQELSARARLGGLSAAGLLAAVFVVASLRASARASRATALASAIDRLAGSGGTVASGLSLAHAAVPPTALTPGQAELSRGLAELAVDDAAALASRADPARLVPGAPARRALLAALALTLGLVLLAHLHPELFAAQFARLVDPHGDHPPYAPTRFEVSPGDALVLYGDSLDVTVRCHGLAPEKLELLVAEPGGAPEAVTMFQEDERVWRSQLREVKAPLTYLVRAPYGRSRRHRVDVIAVPQIERVTFRVTPPAYTGQSPVEGPLSGGRLSGLAGTSVELAATSNRPLARGDLYFEPRTGARRAIACAPDAQDPRRVRARFDLTEPGKLALTLVDSAGTRSRDAFTAPVVIAVDQAPTVQLVEPRNASLATPSSDLPVLVAATDDVALAHLEVFRSIDQTRPLPRELLTKGTPQRSVRRALMLPLKKYGVRPGDVLELFARVEDGEPGRVKSARTAVARVRIISESEMKRLKKRAPTLEEVQQAYRAAERLLENTQAALDRARKELDEALKRQDQERARQARQEIAKLAEQLERGRRALRDAMRAPISLDVERALRLQMMTLDRKLQTLSKRMKEAGASGEGMTVLTDLESLSNELQSARKEFDEKAMKPVKLLAAVWPVMNDSTRFSAQYLAQREIARRISERRGRSREPAHLARVKEMAAEQKELAEGLQAWFEDMAEHSAKLPAEKPYGALKREAEAFVKAVRSAGIHEAMTRAALDLERVDLTAAEGHANRARDLMDGMVKRVDQISGEGGSGQQCLRFEPILSRSLGNTIQQLGASSSSSGSGGKSGKDAAAGLYGPDEGDAGSRGKAGGGEGEHSSAKGDGGRGQGTGKGVTEGTSRPGTLDPTLDADPEAGASGPAVGGIPLRDLPPEYLDRIRTYLEGIAEDGEEP